jgi:hypothetical protein
MHADRTNRLMLSLLGLILLAASGAAMAASTGVFGLSFGHRVLSANRVSDYVGGHGSWLWPVIAVGCALIALACLRWILALVASTDRAGDIIVGDSIDEGTTVLRPTALIDALTSEVSAYHGVDSAKGRVIGDGRDPEVVLTVNTAPAADLKSLHHRIEDEAFAHTRRAAGNAVLPIRLELASWGYPPPAFGQAAGSAEYQLTCSVSGSAANGSAGPADPAELRRNCPRAIGSTNRSRPR